MYKLSTYTNEQAELEEDVTEMEFKEKSDFYVSLSAFMGGGEIDEKRPHIVSTPSVFKKGVWVVMTDFMDEFPEFIITRESDSVFKYVRPYIRYGKTRDVHITIFEFSTYEDALDYCIDMSETSSKCYNETKDSE